MKYFNKAAMFGLDARVALAIFGALSVISGAALYRAIQNANVTAYITKLQEVGKAWEQYYLDTGTTLPKHNNDSTHSHFYILENKYLVEDSTVAGWNGPYIPLDIQDYHLKDSGSIGNIYILTLNDDSDWGNSIAWSGGTCEAGENCFVWIHAASTDKSFVDAIDMQVDGSLSATSGNFKWSTSDSVNYSTFLKYAPITNPNG